MRLNPNIQVSDNKQARTIRVPVRDVPLSKIALIKNNGLLNVIEKPPVESPYMTTTEAAQYLRRSESWLVKQASIPYLKGAPNTYSKKDLDDWFEKHKEHPRLN